MNGQEPAHTEIGTVKMLPRDVGEVMSANEDQRHDDHNDLNDLERELGLG